jgi:hypothetical protein
LKPIPQIAAGYIRGVTRVVRHPHKSISHQRASPGALSRIEEVHQSSA